MVVTSFTVGDKIFADFTCMEASGGGGTADCEGVTVVPDATAPFGWDAQVSGFGGEGAGASSDL